MNALRTVVNNYLKTIGNEAGNDRREKVLASLPTIPRARYLDCGCGDGKFTIEMANKLKTQNIYGIEIIESEARKARKLGIRVKQVDLEKRLPFGANQFAVITAIQVIEHLYDVDIFISEIYRILKPCGIFIVSTENLASWHNIIALILGLQPSTGPVISRRFLVGFHPLAKEHLTEHREKPFLAQMRGHTRAMAYRSFIKIFEIYGFRLLDKKTAGYYPLPRSLADLFTKIDKKHSLDVILKLCKL